jgi:hypothetical protein
VKHFFNQNYWIIIPFILYLMHSDAFGAPKPWTILISMSITPDLEKFAISNLLQLESQIDGTQLKADIVVQAEEKTSGIVRRFLITPRRTPAPPLNRPEDLASLELIQIESSKLEEFFAHPLIPAEKRLRSFIRWATEAYPSRTDIALAGEPDAHYVLVSTRETGSGPGPYELRSFRINGGQVSEETIEVC